MGTAILILLVLLATVTGPVLLVAGVPYTAMYANMLGLVLLMALCIFVRLGRL